MTNAGNATDIKIKVVGKTFSTSAAHFQLAVDLTLPASGVTVLFGRSGAGKTTLLNVIAGLQQIENSEVIVNGDVWQDQNTFLVPHKRSIGYVFQSLNLFPHLTAQQNIEFGVKRMPHKITAERFDEIVSLLDLSTFLHRLPSQLSGGEQQRVAIARALLIEPKLLLMDEPLSALDIARKDEILGYLEKLKQQLSMPVLYVTHSMTEMSRLADHLVLLRDGKVVSQGPLDAVLTDLDLPIQRKEDIGVVLEARIVERDPRWHLTKVALDGAELWMHDEQHPIDSKVRIRILAKDVSIALSDHSDSSILNRQEATIIEKVPQQDGAYQLIKARLGNAIVLVRITARSYTELDLQPGMKVWLQIKSVALAG